jgi:hypothetical protein
MPTGSFCFAPNEGSTISDLGKRVHQVYYSVKEKVEELAGYFKIAFASEIGARNFHSKINAMGWKSKLDGSVLIIFKDHGQVLSEGPIIPAVSETSQQKSNQEVKPQEINTMNIQPEASFDFSCKFSGSKEDAIGALYEIHKSSSFITFSDKNQKRITNVLKKDWIEKHPEEYALTILEFLEIN